MADLPVWDREEAVPVDIGTWCSYESYSDPDQLTLQRNNLIFTGLYTGLGEVRFIYSRDIDRMCDYLNDISEAIRIEDTEVKLEDEVFYTSKMEGAHTSRKRTQELHNGAPIDKDDAFSERMVKNGFSAVKKLNLYGGALSEDILINVWNTLIDGCCMNEDIRGDRYRTGDIEVGGFTGADVQDIPELINGFVDFYNGKGFDDVPFVKASLIHYAFETIHPFCDGNGRMGRLLVNNYLISRGIESARAVSFSMAIDKNRGAYDSAFIRSENIYNDCTPFIAYYTETMASAYEAVYKEQERRHKIYGICPEPVNSTPARKYIVLSGIPGSGKHKEAEKLLAGMPDAVYIRTNDIRKEPGITDEDMVFNTAHDWIRNALIEGRSVIYAATNLDRDTRKGLLELAHGIHDISRQLVVMYCDPDKADSDEPELILRNKAVKLHNNKPDRNEGWDEITIIGEDPYLGKGILQEEPSDDRELKKADDSITL